MGGYDISRCQTVESGATCNSGGWIDTSLRYAFEQKLASYVCKRSFGIHGDIYSPLRDNDIPNVPDEE